MELLKVSDAARRINVSYPTLKQWIYAGKIRSVRTPGGHYRIPGSEIERLTAARGRRGTRRAQDLEAISGRNKLLGTVIAVETDGLLAQVTLDVGGQTVVAIITRASAERLKLRPGVKAYALVKATEVMVIRG